MVAASQGAMSTVRLSDFEVVGCAFGEVEGCAGFGGV